MTAEHHIEGSSLRGIVSLFRRTPGLLLSVLMFVCLDFSVLAVNYTISWSMEQDAIAINLSGRQRMLSQRLTKALLLYPQAKDVAARQATLDEVANASLLFDQTLVAFIRGGTATAGDLRPVAVAALKDAEAATIVKDIQVLWQPWFDATQRFVQQPGQATLYEAAADKAVRANLAVLAGMNRLTSRIEAISLKLSQRLRVIQTTAFVLAFLNFIFILRLLLRRYHDAAAWMEKYREQSLHDPLTGLANRRQMMRGLDSAISRGQDFVLALIDLDGFKRINDTHGHPAGDEFLKALALRLAQCTRGGDLIARTGGDEFVGLFNLTNELAGDPEKAMEAIGQRLQACFEAPVEINGLPFPTHASIGLCRYPQQAADSEALMSRADHAMYTVKQEGGSGWRVCSEAIR